MNDVQRDELVDAWSRARRAYGDECAQEAAVQALEKPARSTGAYLWTVAKRLRKWGYNDGRKWNGTGMYSAQQNLLEITPYGSLPERVFTTSPEGKVIARELLARADPRLVMAAVEANQDGGLSGYPGFLRSSIMYYRRKFFQAVGESWHTMNKRKSESNEFRRPLHQRRPHGVTTP